MKSRVRQNHLTISDYTIPRIRKRLVFADSSLRHPTRKLSPLGQASMKIYKEACAKLLDLETNEQAMDAEELEALKSERIAELRTYERELEYMPCMHLLNSGIEQTLQDKILELKQIEFHARYGEFFAEACRLLKHFADSKKVPGHAALQRKFWTDIWETIKGERPFWLDATTGKGGYETVKKCATHMALRSACISIGFDFKDTLEIVEHYSTRNELLHSNLKINIQSGRWDDLKSILSNDFRTIPLTYPIDGGPTAGLMMKLISSIIDMWFDRDSEEPDNKHGWSPSKLLKDYRKELKGKTAGEIETLRKKMGNEVVERLRQSQRAEQRGGNTE
jgi:hypothetical protein